MFEGGHAEKHTVDMIVVVKEGWHVRRSKAHSHKRPCLASKLNDLVSHYPFLASLSHLPPIKLIHRPICYVPNNRRDNV